MSSKKGVRFTIKIPRKRERNTLVLAQARGEMLKPQRMGDKKHKDSRNPRDWEDEDWGEDSE